MIGSFSQVERASNTAVSRRALLRSQTEQGLKGGHRLVAPIVAKNKLIEVNLELGAADTVVGTGIVENGPRCQRYLMSTRRALPESCHHIRTLVPAPRTLKSVRPTTDGQILLTGLFASELSLKFAQTTWKRRPRHLLTLYVVFC